MELILANTDQTLNSKYQTHASYSIYSLLAIFAGTNINYNSQATSKFNLWRSGANEYSYESTYMHVCRCQLRCHKTKNPFWVFGFILSMKYGNCVSSWLSDCSSFVYFYWVTNKSDAWCWQLERWVVSFHLLYVPFQGAAWDSTWVLLGISWTQVHHLVKNE